MAELLDPSFLRRLESLRFRARRVPALGRPAQHRSTSRGAGVEFVDFRAYAPGEDTRRVDWRVYLRLGRLYLRSYVEELDLPLHLLLDLSESIFLQPERALAARQAAAAFAWVGLAGQDRVRLHPFGDRPLPSFGPVGNRERGMAMLRWLEELQAAGRTGMMDALRRIRGMGGRRGLLVLVSDFFANQGLEEVLTELGRQRHRVLLVQLRHRADADPALAGQVRLRDCETGAERDLTINAQVLARYRQAYGEFNRRLLAQAHSGRCGLLPIEATGDVPGQIESYFTGSRLEL